MKLSPILEEFENIAIEMEIQIIQQKRNFNGGYCLLESEHIIVLNKHKPIEKRINTLTKAFSQLDTSKIYLKPIIRELIESKAFSPPHSTIK